MALKTKKEKGASKKKSKKAFVLTVGDEGAILTHFDKGTLINRVFVDSPFSPDIKLMKKLFDLYPSIPITIYVDIIEQNYVHTKLPPLSSSAVKKQAERKLTRDFQPNDLNNYVRLGRDKEGRKDWQYLFISLANTEPFSNWIELVLEQKNKLNGVYILAVESIEMVNELNSKLTEASTQPWNLIVMHNKVSGFRITAFKEGKIYFTRLTQHLIGENVAEVVAGNLEQEISNTIEYLKRLGFRDEKDAHISIIANEEILKKIELSRMNFGRINKYTPHGAASKLNITYAVKEKDKYADILCSAHFINARKKHLVFNSKITKQVLGLQTATLAISTMGFFLLVGAMVMLAMLGNERPQALKDFKKADNELKESNVSIQKLFDKKQSLPEDIGVMVEVLDINMRLPQIKDLMSRVIYLSVDRLPLSKEISSIDLVFANFTATDNTPKNSYSQKFSAENEYIDPFSTRGGASNLDAFQEKEVTEIQDVIITHNYEGQIDLWLEVKRGELDILGEISESVMQYLNSNEYGIVYEYDLAPQSKQHEMVETVTEYEEIRINEIIKIPTIIKFKGSFREEKKSN